MKSWSQRTSITAGIAFCFLLLTGCSGEKEARDMTCGDYLKLEVNGREQVVLDLSKNKGEDAPKGARLDQAVTAIDRLCELIPDSDETFGEMFKK